MNIKQLIKSFCIFILAYVLMMIPWSGLETAYSRFYKSGAAFLFESFGSKTFVRFFQSDNLPYDIMIGFYDASQPTSDGKIKAFKGIFHSSHYGAYIYIVFVISLILATPISLKRKIWALFKAVILLHCFFAVSMLVLILYTFALTPNSPVVFDPFWKNVLVYIHEGLLKYMFFSFVISIFIWFIVSFRHADWADIKN